MKEGKKGRRVGISFLYHKVIPYFSLLSIGHATKCLGMI